MLQRIFVFFLLVVLLNALASCGGKKWISANTAVEQQTRRQQGTVVTSVQTADQKITFASTGANYDKLERSIVGRASNGSLITVSVDSIQRFFINGAGSHSLDDSLSLSKSMFTERMKQTSVEPIYAARLISDTNALISFAPKYGRVWLFDSTLTCKSTQSESINVPLAKVNSVQVSRFSPGKTLLFVGGLAAVTIGILAIAWSGQDGFFKSGP